ncbi:MAG: conjugative transfer ATPase, partial [Gammaproteobacteria bacterium]|nr:conjugative transfer ATPase [Gammaproteobacteria bacterium]
SKASPDDERDASDDTDDGDENRDILGEMEIAARIMITGGEEEEARKFTRSDRFNLRNAILLAASNVQARGGEQVVTEDVVQGLREMAQDATLNELQRNRLSEMANGLAMFTQGTEGLYFNRPGDVWPVCDVTHMDMGLFAREGYEANLTVSYVGLMNRINALVEAQQHEGRPTIVITDEGHIITTNPLLAPYVVKLTKMWRKLGTWLWIATQNMRDFPDASEKMLSMMEWWVLLTMPQDEIDQIARFRKLTAEQRDLMLSTRKEPGKFVEGVVLADKVQALFRNVVPPIALALAMTENEEKAERGRLMKQFGISELEAAERIAAQIEQARRDAVPGEAV